MKRTYKIFQNIIIVICVIAIFLSLIFSLMVEPLVPLPNAIKLNKNLLGNPTKTLRIFDRYGEEIDISHYSINKTYITSDIVPEHVKNAFICAEDKRFFNHVGIDTIRLFGALKNNLLSGSFKEGASTISQQLMKNTHLTNDKNLKRKIQEMRLAVELERNYTKEQILEKYLNVLYFGNNIYGIASAAKQFFNKDVSSLTISESALIAGIIKNPMHYSPLRNMDNAIARRNLILSLMKNQGKITEIEYFEAIKENPKLSSYSYAQSQFLNGIIQEACDKLNMSKSELYSSGISVHTNFDLALQQKIINSIKKYDNGNSKIAVVLLETKSGKILSYESNTTENIVNMRRSPGSTIKPFVSFIPALEKKLIYPISPIIDEPKSFNGYTPSNFKDKYYGWTTVEESLIHSMNIPAVKLFDSVGVDFAKRTAEMFGLDFSEKDSSYAVALGGLTNGFTLKQLANAYQSLGNMGTYCEASFLNRIENNSTKIFSLPVIKNSTSSSSAYMMNEMLQKCAKEGTAKHLKNINNVSAKTGTVGTKLGNTDAYCIAYNSQYTLLVWQGSDNPKEEILGGNLPTKIAAEFYKQIPASPPFQTPSSITKLDIDIRQLNENKKVTLANENVAPRYRKKATFSIDNIPNEYSGYDEDNFYDYFIGDNFFNFEDYFNLDFNNF